MIHFFFSIIIPSYNRASLITETINSVCAQTFQNWECIVVDDGSTDNTRGVIEALSIQDDRIRYIYQDNAERSNARNNGIRNAKGQWICFLDSDDLYEENHLQQLHDRLKDQKDAGFYFTACKILHEGQLTSIQTEAYDNEPDYFIRQSIIPARVCIHRSILEKFQFDPRIVIVEDSVLWTQIHLHYPTTFLPIDSVVYRWHDENSVNIKNNCFYPRLKGLQLLFKDPFVSTKISRKSQQKALSNCYYGIAKYYALKRNFVQLVWHITRSILSDPKSAQTKAKLYLIYAYFRPTHL
jgi:glycosyltransferase involved in cell wall biosynthesis